MINIQTAWVKPPEQIGGLDHLGSQAPCISIYSQLLPGITNVTDRARYYSLYPWIIYSLDRAGLKNGDEFIASFRRADCLLTLISLRHAKVSKNEFENHQTAVVGSNKLSQALKKLESGQTVRLSEYATRETGDSQRYFKNTLGGFGQYYFGTLRDLQLVSGTASKDVQLIQETGGKVAQAVSAGVPNELFWETVNKDILSLAALDQLSPFCHCQLNKNKAEHTELLNLFTSLPPFSSAITPSNDTGMTRKQGLGFVLCLAREFSDKNYPLNLDNFRGAIYTGALPDGAPLDTANKQKLLFSNWAAYQRGELLSVALQGIFFAILTRYRDERKNTGLTLKDTTDLTDWFWDIDIGQEILKSLPQEKTFSALAKSVLSDMPSLELWSSEDHEVRCADRLILQAKMKSPTKDDISNIVTNSIKVLLALHWRPENTHGYSTNIFPEGYFARYPINLQRFIETAADVGAKQPLTEFLKLLTREWCLEAHLKVALRKLYYQSQSTFRFRPTELGLDVVEVPVPVYSSPRFWQAIRILEDLQAIIIRETDDHTMISPGDYADRFYEAG